MAQVGHNMLLDLAHLEAAFGQGSLPADFDAFAAQAQDPHTIITTTGPPAIMCRVLGCQNHTFLFGP
jgi:hypothetical protein